jgi:Uma2 family endonuclease
MLTRERLYTVDEFWDLLQTPEFERRKLELINGVIVEMSPNLEHGMLAALLAAFMVPFVRANDLGMVAVEVDHYLPEDRYNTRRPDVSFYSKARLKGLEKNQFVPLMPDLAIEIKSPSNSKEDLLQKTAYYLQNGCRMVWLVYPEDQTIAVYTAADSEPRIFGINDVLDGGDLLPGFKLAVKDIFN